MERNKIKRLIRENYRQIEDKIYKVKETINDRFLDTQYDVFFKKKSDVDITCFSSFFELLVLFCIKLLVLHF